MSHVARLEAAAVTGAPAWTIEAVVVLDAVFAALEEEPDDNVAGMSVKACVNATPFAVPVSTPDASSWPVELCVSFVIWSVPTMWVPLIV